MTQSKESIEHLQQNEATKSIADQIKNLTPENPYVALPGNYEIKKIDVERNLSGLSRYTGNFDTFDLDDFISIANDFDQSGSKCFVSKSMAAKCIFNLGSIEYPGHGDLTCSFSPERTSEYQAIINYFNEETLTQKQIIDNCIEYADFISFSNKEGETIEFSMAIKLLRKIDVKQVSENSSEQQSYKAASSAMESVAIDSEGGELPEYINFACKPYSFLNNRIFKMRITHKINDNKILFKPKIQLLQELKQDIQLEMVSLIKERLDHLEVSVISGNFSK